MNDDPANTNPQNQPEPTMNTAPVQAPNVTTPGLGAVPPEPPPDLPTPPIYETHPPSPSEPSPSPEQPHSKPRFWAIGVAVILILIPVGFFIKQQLLKNKTTLSPSPVLEARCLSLKVYDQDWQVLETDQLSELKPGDKVRFAARGQTNTGTFDKARFKINNSDFKETATKKPQSDEFFLEYTIPAGITSFKVETGIHHSSLGWL